MNRVSCSISRLTTAARCCLGYLTTKTHLHTSAACSSVFGPGTWADPVADLEELRRTPKSLPEEDPRRYLFIKPMKSDETPVFYRDPKLDKFIRMMMVAKRQTPRRRRHEKEFIRFHVLEAFELIKRIQYRAWKRAESEEAKNEIIRDPYIIFHKALLNCRPVMKMLPVTRGGTTYKVPWPIGEKEAEYRAMKFLKTVLFDVKKLISFRERTFCGTVARELLAASKNDGMAVKAKQEHHKLCEANRAFTHYRR